MTATSRLLLLLFLAGIPAPGLRASVALQSTSSQTPISKMPDAARQLIAIKVTGSKRFPEAAIAAATGLQMGTAVTDDDFKKAARRLGDTGVFTDIAYTLLLFVRWNQARTARHRCRQVRPRALRGFRLVLRCRTSPPHQGVRPPVRWRTAHYPAVWPTRSPTCCRPCWWKAASPATLSTVRTGKPDGPIEAIIYHV